MMMMMIRLGRSEREYSIFNYLDASNFFDGMYRETKRTLYAKTYNEIRLLTYKLFYDKNLKKSKTLVYILMTKQKKKVHHRYFVRPTFLSIELKPRMKLPEKIDLFAVKFQV